MEHNAPNRGGVVSAYWGFQGWAARGGVDRELDRATHYFSPPVPRKLSPLGNGRCRSETRVISRLRGDFTVSHEAGNTERNDPC
jgi:hypothetical protein